MALPALTFRGNGAQKTDPAVAIGQPRLGSSDDAFETKTLALFAILVVAAILPVLLVRVPAMVDYPNHLARMFVIARAGSAQSQPFYHVAWAFYPNLAMDLVVPVLGRMVGVETACRAFLIASDLLVVGGAVALELVVKRRFDLSGFVALLTLYSLPFAWGFLNFEFALGVALWGIAGWLALGERRALTRFVLHALMVGLLFTAHLFALGIYGFALGVHELWRAYGQRLGFGAICARAAVLAAPLAPIVIAMLATGGTVGREGTAWTFAAKPLWFFGILNGYSLVVALVSAAIVWAGLWALGRRAAFAFEASGAWMLGGFGLLYLAMPFKLFDTAFVDLRVVVAALLIVPAFLRILDSQPQAKRMITTVLCGLICLNLGTVLTTWMSYSDDYEAMIQAFQHMDKRANLLVGDVGDAPDPPMASLSDYPMYNAPTLAVHFADAFVPTFFTSVGKQVVTVGDSRRELAVPYGGPVPADLLQAIAEGHVPEGTPSFVRSWPRDFDYLCIVGDSAPNPLPKLLTRIAGGRRFTLYRIVK